MAMVGSTGYAAAERERERAVSKVLLRTCTACPLQIFSSLSEPHLHHNLRNCVRSSLKRAPHPLSRHLCGSLSHLHLQDTFESKPAIIYYVFFQAVAMGGPAVIDGAYIPLEPPPPSSYYLLFSWLRPRSPSPPAR